MTRAGEYRVDYLVGGLPGIDGDRAGRAQAVLQYRQLATQVLPRVPDVAPVVIVPARIQSRQHSGLVDLQQEHLSEAVGHLWLVVRTAADVQRRWCRGPDQFVQAGRIPCPAVPGKPGKVRLVWLFRYYVAGGVNEPREERVVVGVDGRQAPAGELGGDGRLPGAGTACDLDSAHRCLSSACSGGGANEFGAGRRLFDVPGVGGRGG